MFISTKQGKKLLKILNTVLGSVKIINAKTYFKIKTNEAFANITDTKCFNQLQLL